MFGSWRTATLMRAKRVPSLSRLLRTRRRKSRADQDEVRAEMAAAEAEFARLEAQAAARAGKPEGADG